ncbi:MAG: TonB-dependent receptor domain-containing protein [Limisphaerales bacterium]
MSVYIGDRFRLGPDGHLLLKRADKSICRFYPKSEFEILPPKQTAPPGSFRGRLLAGVLYFFHRGPPADAEIETRMASAAIRGTEFNIQADEAATILTVVDGLVDLTNAFGGIQLTSGEQGVATPGQAPVPRPAIEVNVVDAIQWTLYYPGLLEPQELPFTAEERAVLDESLAAYNSGDLLQALAQYPTERAAVSDAEKIYFGALLLSVGRVEEAQQLLNSISRNPVDLGANGRAAQAVQRLIATVKLRGAEPAVPPQLATEWMAESYYQQSRRQLPAALEAARRAVKVSQGFGFAWARIGELEFSSGRIDEARQAITIALEKSSRNVQAIAVNGFLLAAENKIRAAIAEFEQAISIDPGLANAWLGRGLCRIRLGESQAGREDLLTAAALEPNRAFLRSYLAKAWTDAGERTLAEHELELAKQFDPVDPTAWLYSALLKEQNNRINEAIRDLEHAQDLGTNRAIYRSLFLLDQDRAVRSANLARVYRDAGMTDWSVREAGRAVSADYANYSAHLFLANSYDQLRDPNRISLRYETPAESEYLIANLLAPVGAGMLSQSISQQEYSKLFERNRLGVVSSTEYLSRGAWYQNGAQFGIFGNTSYSFEGMYRSDPGQRPNNDFEERELRLHIKQQFTLNDSIYFRAVHYESQGGDRFQHYDPVLANFGVRTMEKQEPTLTLGYHHEWNAESHFLLTASRFDDTYEQRDPFLRFLLRAENNGELIRVRDLSANLNLRSETELYSVEAQQIWQKAHHSIVLGGRFQTATLDIRNSEFELKDDALNILFDPFTGEPVTPVLPEVSSDISRWSIYLYESWRPIDELTIQGGIVYEHLQYPENVRSIPMSDSEISVERFLPKAGIVWTPDKRTALRGAYTRSLGGASLEQSIRIEPTQVAGFNQAFRSIIPEALIGGTAGARFETYHLSLERKFGETTYASVGGELLFSEVPRTLGAVILDDGVFPPIVGTLSELHDRVDYRERSLSGTIDQLIAERIALGASYRLTDAHFQRQFEEIATPRNEQDSILHRLEFRAVYNDPSGFFGQIQALWFLQDNDNHSIEAQGTAPAVIPSEEFWHFNVFAGYRFWQRKAQVTVGILNLTDQDYGLNPVILYQELPRERTFMARLGFSF